MQGMENIRNGMGNIKPNFVVLKIFFLSCKYIIFILLTIISIVALVFIDGCGLNPVPAPNVISGSDNLHADTNGDALFTFTENGEPYGSFNLRAYYSTASISTPQGGGIQKRQENLQTAPETGYSSSEECGIPYISYYYYMITDTDPHYAKVFIHTVTQNQDGIMIGFNWWLQTQPGERNF